MKHDVLSETLRQLGFPRHESQRSASLLHWSGRIEKREFPAVFNRTHEQASPTMGFFGRFNATRHQQFHRAMGEALSGPVPAELLPHLNDPVLWSSTLLLTAISLGVVFLMTVKPDLLGSLIVLAIAILFGLGASVLLRGVRQTGRHARQHTHA